MNSHFEKTYLEHGSAGVEKDAECQAALLADANLRKQWQRILQVDAQLAALPAAKMPAALAEKILAASQMPAPFFHRPFFASSFFQSRRWLSPSLAFAAGVMLLLLLPLTIFFLTQNRKAEITVLELAKNAGSNVSIPWRGGGGFQSPSEASHLSFNISDARPLVQKIIHGEAPKIRDPLALYNAFPYDSAGKDPIAAKSEIATCPWNSAHRLVRVQVETHRAFQHLSVDVGFDARAVAQYRLLGSQSPALGLPFEAVGAGARVIALYEIEPIGDRPLLGIISVTGDTLFEQTIVNEPEAFANASEDFRFTAAVALFVLETQGVRAEESAGELATHATAKQEERLAFANALVKLNL